MSIEKGNKGSEKSDSINNRLPRRYTDPFHGKLGRGDQFEIQLLNQKLVNGLKGLADIIVRADWEEEDSTKLSFIENKPTIPDPQVRADWDEEDSESPSFIANKPTIPEDRFHKMMTTQELNNAQLEEDHFYLDYEAKELRFVSDSKSYIISISSVV